MNIFKIKLILFFGFLIVLFVLICPIMTVRADFNPGVDQGPPTPQQTAAFNGDAVLANPIGTADPTVIIRNVITAVLGLSGVLAFLAFVYGGLLFLLAGVNADFVKKGKTIMTWAIIGLVVIFSAYAVVLFVLQQVLKVASS